MSVRLAIAPAGTAHRRAALALAARQWPDDPPSGREAEVLVALLRGRGVVGAVSLDTVADVPSPPPRSPGRGDPRGWMVNLVVERSCRGRGIGSRLLRRAAARWAPARFRCAPGLLGWYAARVPVRVVERRPGVVICTVLRPAGARISCGTPQTRRDAPA